MRFADVDRTTIDVYQAVTQMTDESFQTYPFHIDSLLDRAVGPEGCYGVFTANMHTDSPTSPGSDAIVASAKAHGVPVVSARQMLTWLDGRNDSPDTSITANPGAATAGSIATFSFAASPSAGSSFECALDNAAFAALTSSKTYTGITVGSQTFRVRDQARGLRPGRQQRPVTCGHRGTAPQHLDTRCRDL